MRFYSRNLIICVVNLLVTLCVLQSFASTGTVSNVMVRTRAKNNPNPSIWYRVPCDYRKVPEGDAAAKRETAGGVSVVAVQYVASTALPYLNFTDPSHFMV